MKNRKLTNYILIHASATDSSIDVGVAEIRRWHQARKAKDVGYHYIVRRNGNVETGLLIEKVGKHCSFKAENGKSYDTQSIAICLVGGLEKGRSKHNFTSFQMSALRKLINEIQIEYPDLEVLGHRDASPDQNKDGVITEDEYLRQCPSFNVKNWL